MSHKYMEIMTLENLNIWERKVGRKTEKQYSEMEESKKRDSGWKTRKESVRFARKDKGDRIRNKTPCNIQKL